MTNSVQTPKNGSLDDGNISSLFPNNSQSPTQASFEPFSFDGQRDTKDFGLSWSAPFPAALKVTNAATIPQAVSLVRAFTHSGQLHELVKRHGGAIIIRGLPLETASDYSKVAHAFGLQPHVEVGRPPLRTVLAPNVKTANEGPPALPIWPHNEYGWSTINPAWLTFSALEIPTEGGATPITSSIYIAHRLSTLVPEFVEKLQKLGARYTYRYTVNRVVSNTGASIREAYGAHIKDEDDQHTVRQKIEAEVKRHSNKFEWHDDGSLSVTHVVPAIRIHQPTGAPIFFGNITSAWGRSRHHGAIRPPFHGDDGSYHPPPQFGDGTPMDLNDLDLLLDIAEQSAVNIAWTQGDLVILDNYAVQHSRQPWKGARLVLAALWDDEGRVEDFPEGREILNNAPRYPVIGHLV